MYRRVERLDALRVTHQRLVEHGAHLGSRCSLPRSSPRRHLSPTVNTPPGPHTPQGRYAQSTSISSRFIGAPQIHHTRLNATETPAIIVTCNYRKAGGFEFRQCTSTSCLGCCRSPPTTREIESGHRDCQRSSGSIVVAFIVESKAVGRSWALRDKNCRAVRA